MKEFVRYGARAWSDLAEEQRKPYYLMGEVEKLRYERDKCAFMSGGVQGPLDLQLQQAELELAQRLQDYRPEIIIQNIELIKVADPRTSGQQNTNGPHNELKLLLAKFTEISNQ